MKSIARPSASITSELLAQIRSSISEGVMSDIAGHPAFERLNTHIRSYNDGKIDADTLGSHCVKIAKKIATDTGHDHKDIQSFVNNHVDASAK